MSLHRDPATPAERLARHLEDNYGLQLDPARHAALIADLEEFLSALVDNEGCFRSGTDGDTDHSKDEQALFGIPDGDDTAYTAEEYMGIPRLAEEGKKQIEHPGDAGAEG